MASDETSTAATNDGGATFRTIAADEHVEWLSDGAPWGVLARRDKDAALWVSDDGAETWWPSVANAGCRYFANSNDSIFCELAGSLSRSDDAGQSWKVVRATEEED